MPGAAQAAVTGLILAAGSGERLDHESKAFLPWRGEPLLAHAIAKMTPICATILVGLRGPDIERAEPLLQQASREHGRLVKAVAGGPARRDTLLNLLGHAHEEWVLLHDVARPFTEASLFSDVLAAAMEHGAASAGFHPRVRDGLAEHVDGFIDRVVPQSSVVSMQTPQACRTEWLRTALRDDTPALLREHSVAALLRAHGHPVKIVSGSQENVKITYPEDLQLLR